MREDRPFLLRNEFHEVLLDLHRVRMRGQSQASGDACDVSVDHDAHRQIEGVPENHVRRLAAHAGQRGQFLHGARHLSAVLLHDRLRCGDHRFCFIAEKTGLPDVALHRRLSGGRERSRVRILMKQRLGDDVDAHVRGLRGKNRSNEELERIRVVQRAFRLRIHPLETHDDLGRALLLLGRHRHRIKP